jgi:ParB-like chromosome segregation protein Spo0J
MPTQEQMFEMLKAENVTSEYNAAVPLKEIMPPEDGLEPSDELVEDVRLNGVIEPLLLNSFHGGRFKIISGTRRYKAAVLAGRESVRAMITRVSPAKRAILKIRMHTLRAENALSFVDSLQVLIDKGYSEKQIDELTNLLPQERQRFMRLRLADKRLVPAMRDKRVPPSLAETIAKLPPKQQAQVLDKLNDKDQLRMSDVHEVKEVRTRAAVEALPQELFTRNYPIPVNGNGHHVGESNPGAAQESSRNEADGVLEILRALNSSGALDGKNNKLSRKAIADAKLFLTEMEGR